MVEVSDIPDWSVNYMVFVPVVDVLTWLLSRNYTESGLPYNVWTTLPGAGSLAKMLDVSPIQYVDKVRTVALVL